MLKIVSPLIMAYLLVSACNQSGASADAVEDTIQKVTGVDSAVIQQPEVPGTVDYSLTGFYQGHMPCESCDGAQQTLLLKEDGRFMLQDLPREPNATRINHEGVWSLTKGNIVLFAGNMVIGKFIPKGDTLLTSQRQGTILSDSASRKFSLIRRHNAGQHLPYKKRLSSGYQFLATGTEPFWGLQLDSTSTIHFRLADWKTEKLFDSVSILKSTDSITVKSASDSLLVHIYRDFCSDGMSDLLFEFRVEIKYHSQIFRGCGIFATDPFHTDGLK